MESTTGAFSRSSCRTYSRIVESLEATSAGRLACAVGRPALSVTMSGTPCSTMLLERSNNACVPASSLVSLCARKTRAYMRLERSASRRRSLTTRRVYSTYDDSRMTRKRPTRSSGAPRRIALSDPVATDVRPQRLRHDHRSVRPLMLLEQAGDDARKGQARAVECMHEPRLLPLGRAIAD